MQTQSELDLRESQWLRDFHLESIPPQVQMGERRLLGLTDRCHELRRLDRSFRGFEEI
jgi:hypothetical protein